jgi:hypothetical protein
VRYYGRYANAARARRRRDAEDVEADDTGERTVSRSCRRHTGGGCADSGHG